MLIKEREAIKVRDLQTIFENGRKRLAEEGLLGWCDATAGSSPVTGDTASTLSAIRIVWKVLHESFSPNLGSSFAGVRIKTPIAPAPIGGLTRLSGTAEQDLVEACASAGVPVFLSDGIQGSLEGLVARTQTPVFYVLKPLADLGAMEEKIREAEEAGVSAIGLTVDVIAGLKSEHKLIELKGIGPTAQNYYSEVRSLTELPMFLKGLLHASDVKTTADLGYEGVVLSNHGMRVIETSISPLESLILLGQRRYSLDVAADGGIRSGLDVFKTLALGARLVLLGRPVIYSLADGGKESLAEALHLFLKELRRALLLTCARSIQDIDESTVFFGSAKEAEK